MKRFNRFVATAFAVLCMATAWSLAAAQTAAPQAAWQGARLGFVGRVVKDLDRSVAFYKMIG
ncbi:MAG TPA: hypothetical protein VGV09_02505, partial [Steroidobacteraceae bacterium]|nr:hypothetical protein [Steroidobacteraceae bacterium]